MSKQNKEPSTPESRAAKLANKQMLRKVFTSTFFKAFAICLAVLLIYSVCYIAFINPNSVGTNTINPVSDTNTAENAVVQNNNSSASAGNTSGDAAATGDANTAAVTELSASSSQADILAYFNTAINKVKPNAKTVILVKETNSRAGDVTGKLPLGISTSTADSIISAFMGDKKAEDMPAPATTVEAKNAIFPVENESWSSKLTVDDIESATCKDNSSAYEITIKVKEDAVSADTAHGVGHNGKVFSVIQASTIMANIPSVVSGILKEAETGHKDGIITVTVDKATGNVTSANYYFTWTLHVLGTGLDAQMVFGLEKQFTIDW